MILIVFEGIDGSGKSTQLELVKEYLQLRGNKVYCTRQPGGTELGHKIREIVLNHPNISAMAEMFLFQADRAEHYDKFIKPLVDEDCIVLCDRWSWSTMAYQPIDSNIVHNLSFLAENAVKPDLILYYEINNETYIRRNAHKKHLDTTEYKYNHCTVINNYQRIYQRFHHQKTAWIDGNNDIDEVFNDTMLSIITYIEGGILQLTM